MPSTGLPSTTFGPVQPFGSFEDQHGPARAAWIFLRFVGARGGLDGGDFVADLVEDRGHLLVHADGIVAFEEVRRVAVAAEQRFEFVLRDAREHRGIGDLVAVEMEDRQDRAVFRGIQKFVGVPAGGARSGFGFAVADDAGDDQIGIVVRRAVGVEQRVAELAAFVNRAGSFGRNVAGNSVGPGKLAEQALDAVVVALDVRIDFGVRAFEIGVRDDAGAAVAGADDVHHVEVALGDQAVEVGVDEVEARRWCPSGRAGAA